MHAYKEKYTYTYISARLLYTKCYLIYNQSPKFPASSPYRISNSPLKSTVGNSAICTFKLPYGLNVTSTTFPVQFLGASGTGAGILLYSGHSISHPRAVMLVGGAPDAQMGFAKASVSVLLALQWKVKEEGSMAMFQGWVAVML